jgi:hypothetical protein
MWKKGSATRFVRVRTGKLFFASTQENTLRATLTFKPKERIRTPLCGRLYRYGGQTKWREEKS